MHRRWRFVVVATLSVLLSFLLDHLAYERIVFARVYDQDWGRFLRVMGFWPTWGIAALALWMQERGAVPQAGRRALLLAGAPALSGITGELLKLLLRRERPETNAGHYVFRAFSDRPFSSGGLALPSSHTIVAFGAAAMLSYLFPKARWVWFALATGCAITRVLARAHFLSDVVAAAVVAMATTAWLWRQFTPGRLSV